MKEFKRFIKTDEGRVEDLTRCKVSEDLVGKPFNPPDGWLIYRDSIVKDTDTLEEMCEEFVLVAPYRFKLPKTTSDLNRDFDEMKDFYTDKDDIIYGAVWTDKGLKYIAKVNEEGELCLL